MEKMESPWPSPRKEAVAVETAKEMLGKFGVDDAGLKFSVDEAYQEERRQHVSPRGELWLPPYADQARLEKRRLEYSIPDQTFYAQPFADRIWVHQLPSTHRGTFVPGGKLVMTDEAREYSDHYATRGVLVGAGLTAAETLASHGIFVGHIIRFTSTVVRKNDIVIFPNSARVFFVLVMTAGDISASEDTWDDLRSGRLEVKKGTDGRWEFFQDGKSLGLPRERVEYPEYT